MKYTVLIEKPAEKFIVKLPEPEKERVLRAISRLPDEGDRKRLQGIRNEGIYRLRVGQYRVLYRVEEDCLVVCVIDAGNRGEIYNRYS